MTEADPLVDLARRAIIGYVRDGRVVDAEDLHSSEPRRAGVFVSLHLPDGSLRGCIGTTECTRGGLAEEIIGNAICAATRDPRFYPLTERELDQLDISVDVLGPAEEVQGLQDLNPKVYGLILETDDGRRALLLPDLDGVETAEQQLQITARKGGIDPQRDSYRIFRFEVQRHH